MVFRLIIAVRRHSVAVRPFGADRTGLGVGAVVVGYPVAVSVAVGLTGFTVIGVAAVFAGKGSISAGGTGNRMVFRLIVAVRRHGVTVRSFRADGAGLRVGAVVIGYPAAVSMAVGLTGFAVVGITAILAGVGSVSAGRAGGGMVFRLIIAVRRHSVAVRPFGADRTGLGVGAVVVGYPVAVSVAVGLTGFTVIGVAAVFAGIGGVSAGCAGGGMVFRLIITVYRHGVAVRPFRADGAGLRVGAVVIGHPASVSMAVGLTGFAVIGVAAVFAGKGSISAGGTGNRMVFRLIVAVRRRIVIAVGAGYGMGSVAVRRILEAVGIGLANRKRMGIVVLHRAADRTGIIVNGGVGTGSSLLQRIRFDRIGGIVMHTGGGESFRLLRSIGVAACGKAGGVDARAGIHAGGLGRDFAVHGGGQLKGAGVAAAALYRGSGTGVSVPVEGGVGVIPEMSAQAAAVNGLAVIAHGAGGAVGGAAGAGRRGVLRRTDAVGAAGGKALARLIVGPGGDVMVSAVIVVAKRLDRFRLLGGIGLAVRGEAGGVGAHALSLAGGRRGDRAGHRGTDGGRGIAAGTGHRGGCAFIAVPVEGCVGVVPNVTAQAAAVCGMAIGANGLRRAGGDAAGTGLRRVLGGADTVGVAALTLPVVVTVGHVLIRTGITVTEGAGVVIVIRITAGPADVGGISARRAGVGSDGGVKALMMAACGINVDIDGNVRLILLHTVVVKRPVVEQQSKPDGLIGRRDRARNTSGAGQCSSSISSGGVIQNVIGYIISVTIHVNAACDSVLLARRRCTERIDTNSRIEEDTSAPVHIVTKNRGDAQPKIADVRIGI